jgi:glyoxalase family protein
MDTMITGLHHVTALAADPNENHDFYTRVLGHRLVKTTVNFDDPFTYHLYFGDERGTPGTLLTHFPHPRAREGVHGSPEILETTLRAPEGSLASWAERLRSLGVAVSERDDGVRPRIAFEDPHGMRFSILERADPERPAGYAGGGVDGAHAITGVDGVVIRVPDAAETARFLEGVLGFDADRTEGGRDVLRVGAGAGERVELVEAAEDPRTQMGAGTVHHVAWRVPDDAAQAEVARRVAEAGVPATPVQDRQYFRSIYFRVPGGVIFEVATDGPGFDVDEPVETLGEALKLPPQHEPLRERIERRLVPIRALDAPA